MQIVEANDKVAGEGERLRILENLLARDGDKTLAEWVAAGEISRLQSKLEHVYSQIREIGEGRASLDSLSGLANQFLTSKWPNGPLRIAQY